MSVSTFDAGIVTGIMEDAIEFCAKKTGLNGRDQTLEALRCGDCSVCEYLRYGLAEGVAEYLGSVDDTVKVVYTYEPSTRPAWTRPSLAGLTSRRASA